MFKIGDVVKGSKYHCNFARMEDTGVVYDIDESGAGYWVVWYQGSAWERHFAEEHELTLVGESVDEL